MAQQQADLVLVLRRADIHQILQILVIHCENIVTAHKIMFGDPACLNPPKVDPRNGRRPLRALIGSAAGLRSSGTRRPHLHPVAQVRILQMMPQ
jgi:hypothetical protein